MNGMVVNDTIHALMLSETKIKMANNTATGATQTPTSAASNHSILLQMHQALVVQQREITQLRQQVLQLQLQQLTQQQQQLKYIFLKISSYSRFVEGSTQNYTTMVNLKVCAYVCCKYLLLLVTNGDVT